MNKLVAEVDGETLRIFGKTNTSYFSNLGQAKVAASAWFKPNHNPNFNPDTDPDYIYIDTIYITWHSVEVLVWHYSHLTVSWVLRCTIQNKPNTWGVFTGQIYRVNSHIDAHCFSPGSLVKCKYLNMHAFCWALWAYSSPTAGQTRPTGESSNRWISAAL